MKKTEGTKKTRGGGKPKDILKAEILNNDLVAVLDLEPYNQDLLFLYGDNLDILKDSVVSIVEPIYHEAIDEVFEYYAENRFRGLFSSAHPLRLIYIRKQEDISELVSLVSHESLHATIDVLTSAGLKLSRKSEEAFAYLHANIVKRIFEAIQLDSNVDA